MKGTLAVTAHCNVLSTNIFFQEKHDGELLSQRVIMIKNLLHLSPSLLFSHSPVTGFHYLYGLPIPLQSLSGEKEPRH